MKFTSLFFILSAGLLGCGTDQKESSDEISRTEKILRNNAWKITSITANKAIDFNMDGNKSTDILAQNTPCQSDDIFVLNSDHTLELLDGTIKCSGRDSLDNRGAWAATNTTLTLQLPKTSPAQFHIETYNEQAVIFSKPSPNQQEKDIILTYTFKRVLNEKTR